MKKTIVIVGFLLCLALIIALTVLLIRQNESDKLDRQTADGQVVSNLARFAGRLIPAERLDEYDASQIEKYKIETARYIYAASSFCPLSSYHKYENFYSLISGLNFLSQIDKLTLAITEEDSQDLMYLCAHMYDEEIVESLSKELLERIKPFDYSLDS